MADILVLHGPNLNLLGSREPEIYGSTTLADVDARLTARAAEQGLVLEAFQSNSEGDLVDRVHRARQEGVRFALVNAGALTHSSIGLRDALLGVDLPFIEVHISNLFAREEFRQHSYLSDIAVGLITGLGTLGYELALQAAIARIADA